MASTIKGQKVKDHVLFCCGLFSHHTCLLFKLLHSSVSSVSELKLLVSYVTTENKKHV